MPPPLLLDLTHTSHTRARTGIQRVCRSLHAALGNAAEALTFDPHQHAWRRLQAWERATLAADSVAAKRGARWPLIAKLRGRAHRVLHRAPPKLPENSGLIVPEAFSPAVARALPALFARVTGPRVALFHDAIALKYPELTPTGTVARFPAYLIELLGFDGIAAVSDDSRASLVDYWRWLGVPTAPPVATLTLGIDIEKKSSAEVPQASHAPEILCVGSLEGRKNHLALLEACEGLWASGAAFTLRLIGLAQPQTAGAAISRLRELQAAGRPLRYDGPASDDAVAAAYATCAFTVYPSLLEGFGLPVLESLAHGKPCLCSARGALGESARGGGCVPLENLEAPALAQAIGRLLGSPRELEQLGTAARARTFKTSAQYAADLTGWMRTLPRRG